MSNISRKPSLFASGKQADRQDRETGRQVPLHMVVIVYIWGNPGAHLRERWSLKKPSLTNSMCLGPVTFPSHRIDPTCLCRPPIKGELILAPPLRTSSWPL